VSQAGNRVNKPRDWAGEIEGGAIFALFAIA